MSEAGGKKKLSCIVIMPFGKGEHAHEHLDRYEALFVRAVNAFNEVSKKYSIECKRADDPANVGRIHQQILTDLQTADIVLADLKGLNPNVMYELGVRHAVRHGTIILVPEETDLPFELKSVNALTYGSRKAAIAKLVEKLHDVADDVASGGSPTADSPVLHDPLGLDELPQVRLTRLSSVLGDRIAEYLSTHSSWAIDTLERVRTGWISRPIFDDRMHHYQAEKQEIANFFVPFLWRRCAEILRKGYRYKWKDRQGNTSFKRKDVSKIFLVVDSGTTLVPVLRALAKHALEARRSGDRTVDGLELVTNNLTGLGELIEHGRLEPDNRYSESALACQLLPGVPMPVYSAVAGKLTEKALENLKKSESDAVFIGLWTGNWIRIRTSDTRCPVPMARGAEHKDFKDALVKNCDEAYVLAPLGKIFVNTHLKVVNGALGFASNGRGEQKPYGEVTITDEQAETVKLVSTRRPANCLLTRHGATVAGAVDAQTAERAVEYAGEAIQSIPHIMNVFEELPGGGAEFATEFPHKHTRHNEQFLEHFGVHDPNEEGGSGRRNGGRPAHGAPAKRGPSSRPSPRLS
ncbi:MAG TPA: hypothetical protein VKU41_11370 [Polyangiaceae bacterium]|nr:hypothetical protein [Polyangiaceae bacterium]